MSKDLYEPGHPGGVGWDDRTVRMIGETPPLTEAEQQITLAYLRGYGDLFKPWTPELHIAGLKEVFRAGADAGRRQSDRSVAAGVWDAAIEEARKVVSRRAGSVYETDIDLLTLPNPHKENPRG